MKKKNYSVPKLEQVSTEADTPVICSSGGKPNLTGFTASAGSLFTICCLVLATLLPSCEKKTNQITNNPVINAEAVPLEFNCSNEWSSGSHTKVAIDAITGTCTWEKDDKIAIFNNKGDQAVFNLASGAGSDKGIFSGEIVPSDANDNIYYAVYPSSAVKSANGGKSVTVTIPSEQHYLENSAERTFPFAGHSTGDNIQFQPVAGILRMGIKGSNAVSKAILTDNSGNPLAGDFLVDCSSAYPTAIYSSYGRQSITLVCDNPVQLNEEEETYFSFIIPVNSFTSGFSLNLYDIYGKICTVSTIKNNSIGFSDIKYIDDVSVTFSDNYLTFTSRQDGSTVTLNKNGSPHDISLSYSTDGKIWQKYTIGQSITLNDGEFVKFKGDNSDFSINKLHFYNYGLSGKIYATGTVMSLLDESLESTSITSEYCFYGLFKDCTALYTAPELTATSLSACCYSNTFSGCTNLQRAPELPATTLPDGRLQPESSSNNRDYDGVYSFMFDGCKSLTYPPELKATKLGTFCYSGMFRGCSSLVTFYNLDLGEIPEGALGKGKVVNANGCCASMFQGCTSLKDIPVISYSKIGSYAFSYMFYNCTSLTKVVMNNSEGSSAYSLYGTFMGCTNLTDITVHITKWTNDYYYWLYGVAAKGTFHCPQKLKDNTTSRNYNTVPSGWTMVADD